MNMKLFGGILLIIGTAIGGGMLALPIATSPIGFINSSLLLLGCWVVMTAGAFLILEVNLWFPANSNIISMSKKTIGRTGEWITWATYLLLLYSLLAAYIAGGTDFFVHLLDLIHIHLPHWLCVFLFTLLLGQIVFQGIHAVDHINRGLMSVKLISLFILIIFIAPHVQIPLLEQNSFNYLTSTITVAMTSFGFATIIPSLRTYFHGDVKKLRLAILIGSLIPLICYLLWDFVVMGVIPRTGDQGLISILHSNRSTSDFVTQLSHLLQKDVITSFARIFTSICLLTSFLGVSLCLSDFISDGLKFEKSDKKHRIYTHLITFLPPLLIVLFYPGAFIMALSYAGVYCLILLVFLPALMAWSGRYIKKIESSYQVKGGKLLLILLMLIALLIITQSMVGMLK